MKKESRKSFILGISGTLEPEATTGFEPVIKVLQTCALPLGYVALTSLCIVTKIKSLVKKNNQNGQCWFALSIVFSVWIEYQPFGPS